MSADKLYALLHRQIDHHAYPAALKTTAKLLALDAHDALALATRTQLLVALDRYRDALALDSTHDDPLARAYCLYKLARPHDARKELKTAHDSTAHTYDPRAVDVLEAQLHYRLGEYEQARDLFDDLAATADQDSPELADLQANSSAASAHLDFLASLPSHLAAAASESDSSTSAPLVPSIDELESRPLALVLPASLTGAASSSAAAAVRLAAAAAAPSSSSSAAPPPSKPRTRRPLPKSFDPSRPPPADAADRWIPKRERPSMRDALLQAKEKARGKKRERGAGATGEGEGALAGAAKGVGKNAGSGGGGGGAGGAGGGKKKKGRK
ncbi:hypothetical protein Rhopal_005025-T1 [Rhodotorula paludigena]|uniref:Signal recognition particle subunit SRP72 n=1 Tax=Rhodotorula paludigena TaxID=86838 RepID=A0AAV5GRA4_9BASI|nr:hypothetical protein Rhopal_005025-T1 [Rhodotorula paludigena]